MTHKLPLFPLGMVLFPNAPLPLHIFEDRYREMVARCIEQNMPFGVVLIRDGVAESTEVIFHSVGTTAQISDGVKLEDGRYLINTIGQRRFRIESVVQKYPYYVASVSFLNEELGGDAAGQASELRSLYTRYWKAIALATGTRQEPEPPPEDPTDLTYWLAHRLQVENDQKQHWLETDVSTRLQEMSAALRAELALLPENPGGSGENGWSGMGSWN